MDRSSDPSFTMTDESDTDDAVDVQVGSSYQCKVHYQEGPGCYLAYVLVTGFDSRTVKFQWYYDIAANPDGELPQSIVRARRRGALLSAQTSTWTYDEFRQFTIREVVDVSHPHVVPNWNCELVVVGMYDPVERKCIDYRHSTEESDDINDSNDDDENHLLPVPKDAYMALLDTAMGNPHYAFFMVLDVTATGVVIAWFYEVENNPDGEIPAYMLRRVPKRARRGFWFSMQKETWSLKHFQEVTVRPVVNVSWPITGWDDRCELNVTGYYNPAIRSVNDRFREFVMP